MTFFINAWLERENPILELRESTTNRMVYHLEGEPLNELLNSGELSTNDLSSCKCTHSVIRDLLLKCITEDNFKKDSVEQNNKTKSNTVIKFPGKFRKSSKVNSSFQNRDNIIYLFSVLNQKLLKRLEDAIY